MIRVFPAPRTGNFRDRVKREGPYDDYYRKEAQLGVFGTDNPDDRLPGKDAHAGT